MKINSMFRKWHNWLGVILTLPIFIVGLTAVFITFEGTYKNRPGEPQIATSWLPGYTKQLVKKDMGQKAGEICASLLLPDSTRLLGTAFGLYAVRASGTQVYPELSGFEIHCLACDGETVLAGTKKGLFQVNATTGECRKLLEKEVRHIDVSGPDSWAVADNKMLTVTTNAGTKWQTLKTMKPEVAEQSSASYASEKSIPLHRFIMDLHTGKAFFGKAFEKIWIFMTGFSICILTFTGLYLWWIKQRRKKLALKSVKQ